MKLRLRVSVLILICASSAVAQTKAQETPPKTQEAPKAQGAPKAQEAPKIEEAARTQETALIPAGTETASGIQTKGTESKVPVAGHPVASPQRVKNLYIEPMVHDFDQDLKAEFSRQLAGRIAIVSKPEDADAVMTGIGEWHNGTAPAVTGRLAGLHGPRGAVQVLSRDSLLWASEAWGQLKSGSQRRVADRIVHNFKNALAGKETSETFY